MTERLSLAVPSKGRLEEQVNALFAAADIPLQRDGSRGYRGQLKGLLEVDLIYLSASEIATRLGEGAIHLGVTGEDLIREEIPDVESRVVLLQELGFGHANVVVAIPDAWIDVTHMADLAEVAGDFRQRHGHRLRVATKYIQLTQDFFAAHGITDYTIVQSFGATEGAPSSGAAEAIVDITSTGATLVANQLRVPEDGVILKSQANLAASLEANWSSGVRDTAWQLFYRLEAYLRAQKQVEICFPLARGDHSWLYDTMSQTQAHALHDMETERAETARLLVHANRLPEISQKLHQRGKSIVSAQPASRIFSAESELFATLSARLPH